MNDLKTGDRVEILVRGRNPDGPILQWRAGAVAHIGDLRGYYRTVTVRLDDGRRYSVSDDPLIIRREGDSHPWEPAT